MNKLLLGMALAAITSGAYAQTPEADVIYSNTFAESLDDWTITSDKEGWSGWYVNANKGCAACSSWTGELGTFIGESWMMKEFDLSEFDGVSLAVEQGFFRLFPQEQGDRFTLNIRK